MSHAYYSELWLVTRSDLEKLLELERRLQEEAPIEKKSALNIALSIYVRYVFRVQYRARKNSKYYNCIDKI